VDNLLYWFLTRRPSAKLGILFTTTMIAAATCCCSLSFIVSSPETSHRTPPNAAQTMAAYHVTATTATIEFSTQALQPILTSTLNPQPTSTSTLPLQLTAADATQKTTEPMVDVTPTESSPPPIGNPTPSSVSPPSTETAITNTPTASPPNCQIPGVQLTSPGTHQVLQGPVTIRGTANIANFQYYKIEIGAGQAPKDHEWMVVEELHYSPVVNGVLATLDSNAYPSGVYTLRLVVVDQGGNYPDPCCVTIRIER
jgi:hypothetical protein